MLSALDAARHLAELYADLPKDPARPPLDAARLQALLYYCQGWSIAVTGGPLFADPIEAGDRGPTVAAVADRLAGHRGAVTPDSLSEASVAAPLNKTAVIRLVLTRHGGVPPHELVEMAHAEPISLAAMQDHFRGLSRDYHYEITGGRPLMPSLEDIERGEEQLARGEARPAAEVFAELRRRSSARV